MAVAHLDWHEFMAKVVASDVPHLGAPCWIWTGSLTDDGYGLLPNAGRRMIGSNTAHRYSYIVTFGHPRPGMVLDHRCRIRSCVQPLHLREVTAVENVLQNSRSFGALNSMKTHCPQGHPYDEVNTYLNAGRRACRACRAERSLTWHARKRARAGQGSGTTDDLT